MEGTFTFNLRLKEGETLDPEEYGPGKFLQITVLGVGEAPISIAGIDAESRELRITVRAVGTVTVALCRLRRGDEVGVRGPFGNGFPLNDIEGKNLIMVGGGLGLPPLRHLVATLSLRRDSYGSISLLYGARSPADLLYGGEMERLCGKAGVDYRIIVEAPQSGWSGDRGQVTDLLDGLEKEAGPMAACICGPEPMMVAAAEKLKCLGLDEADILCSIERQMRCGVGKCGHCCLAEKYVCTDGPVFSYKEITSLMKAEGKS